MSDELEVMSDEIAPPEVNVKPNITGGHGRPRPYKSPDFRRDNARVVHHVKNLGVFRLVGRQTLKRPATIFKPPEGGYRQEFDDAASFSWLLIFGSQRALASGGTGATSR